MGRGEREGRFFSQGPAPRALREFFPLLSSFPIPGWNFPEKGKGAKTGNKTKFAALGFPGGRPVAWRGASNGLPRAVPFFPRGIWRPTKAGFPRPPDGPHGPGPCWRPNPKEFGSGLWPRKKTDQKTAKGPMFFPVAMAQFPRLVLGHPHFHGPALGLFPSAFGGDTKAKNVVPAGAFGFVYLAGIY